MVAEIKATVDPDPVFEDGLLLLRIHWPLAGLRNILILCHCYGGLFLRSRPMFLRLSGK